MSSLACKFGVRLTVVLFVVNQLMQKFKNSKRGQMKKSQREALRYLIEFFIHYQTLCRLFISQSLPVWNFACIAYSNWSKFHLIGRCHELIVVGDVLLLLQIYTFFRFKFYNVFTNSLLLIFIFLFFSLTTRCLLSSLSSTVSSRMIPSAVLIGQLPVQRMSPDIENQQFHWGKQNRLNGESF